MAAISDLIGKTIESVYLHDDGFDDYIKFVTSCDKVYKMLHFQDCCECVYISDICGDIKSLAGGLVVDASEESGDIESGCESGTWTFYKIDTTKGFVTIRWNGESNGYYSEAVSFIECSGNKD